METNNKISEIIQKNFISKISYFSKYNSEIKISENSDFTRVDSMLPSDTFNICVLKNKNSLEKVEVFQEITEYFNKKSFPAAVWLWNDNCASKERMEESGFGLSEIEKGMYIDTCKIKEKDLKYEGFTIEKVSSDKQMEDFSKVIASIFGETEEAHYVKRQYDILGQKKIYTDTEMTFFVGYFA